MTEAEVGAACDRVATLMGWTVERYEQSRNTRIKEGLPDRRYVKKGGACLWVELKRPKGKLTEAQYDWLIDELNGGGLAVTVDSITVLADLLREAGSPSSMVRSSLRDRCRELVALCALRGWRNASAPAKGRTRG